MNEGISIAEKIKGVRELAGLTQAQLAEKVGTTPQNISQYERGIRNPKYGTLCKIADALGCNVTDLDESLAISVEDIATGLSALAKEDEITIKRIKSAYSKLNAEGRAKAAERVEELTEIKRFQNNTTLYDSTIQELKATQGDETVQKILERTDDIIFAPETVHSTPAGQGEEEPETKK